MKYFLDTEFNGMGGELISLALVGDDGRELYLADTCQNPEPWVKQNVIPIVSCEGAHPIELPRSHFSYAIADFLNGDAFPLIISDWPDDIRYFCQAVIVGPGQMINVPRLSFEVWRIDAYPTTLRGAVQHNALWDARALKHKA